MKDACPLGHTFVTYREVNPGDKRDINRLAEIRTFTRLVSPTGSYTRELYLVCPVCGVVFRPSMKNATSERER